MRRLLFLPALILIIFSWLVSSSFAMEELSEEKLDSITAIGDLEEKQIDQNAIEVSITDITLALLITGNPRPRVAKMQRIAPWPTGDPVNNPVPIDTCASGCWTLNAAGQPLLPNLASRPQFR